VTTSFLNFKKKNRRFFTNMEPKFKIEHGRVKEHKKRHTIGFFLKNNSNLSARSCIFLIVICPTESYKRGVHCHSKSNLL